MNIVAGAHVCLTQIMANEYVEVGIDERQRLQCVRWKQHAHNQDFQQIYRQLVAVAIERKIKYWYSDARATHFIEFADQNWLLSQMAPLIQQASLQRYARVTTPESMALMDASRVIAEIEQKYQWENKFTLHEFLCPEIAMAWLLDLEL